MVAEDIKIKEKFTLKLNYFEYGETIAEHFYQNLKGFTFTTNPSLNPENAHMINLDELENINVNHFNNIHNKQLHIARRYFTQVGGMSEKLSRLYYNSERINFTDVESILKLANTSLDKYLEYLYELNSQLTMMDIEVLKSLLNIFSPIKEGKPYEHVLFKDVAFCACGNVSTRKKNRTSPITYYCKSKIKRYNLIPCKYKATQEIIIIEKIKKDKNIIVKSRADVNGIVQKIIIKSKFDFDIIYK